MRPQTPWLIAAVLTLTQVSPAWALCIYDGELYAHTTIEQEFADSRWVVRVRLASAFNSWSDGEANDEGQPWTLYKVRVLEPFKGHPPTEIDVFTHRNSGGFYMDIPGGGHDIGGDYLLFLSPIEMRTDDPDAARGAAIVNYNCGQSRPWSEVTSAEKALLEVLARR